MKKYIVLTAILFACSIMLIACSDDESNSMDDMSDNANEENKDSEKTANIPEEVIKDAEANPIELENQMELEVGDTGYTVTQLGEQELAVTLNGLERTQKFGEETREGDNFYLIGDFTFKNLGDDYLTVEKPEAAKVSDTSEIENDTFNNRGDLIGIGAFANPNFVKLEPGEERTQKLGLAMKGTTSDYMVFFGLDDGNNKYYRNKVAWIIDPDQMDEIESLESFQ